MSDWCARLQTKAKIAAVDEHRTAHDPIGQVVAAGHVRVARDEDVPRRDVVEGREHSLDDQAAAAGVDRDAVGLADEPAAAVGEEAGEVVALVEDRAARRPQHHLAHALRDMVDPLLHERQRHRIEPHARAPSSKRIRKLPMLSTVQTSPGARMTEVVASSMIAGPSTAAPGIRSAPR